MELGITLFEAAIEAEAEAFFSEAPLASESSTRTAQALALSYDTGRKLEAAKRDILT